MQDTTFRQLRAVASVARTGKIINAAKELNVTAPAVTMQIKQLEEAVGMPLFERAAGGLRPTDAGSAIVHAASRIEAELADCAAALNSLKGLEEGSVAVGVVSTAKYFAPQMLAAFTRAYPRINLTLSIANREETLVSLQDHAHDIYIMGRPPTDMSVESQVIGKHPHVIIAPPDHPLARRKRLALTDLANETFLVRESGSGTRILMHRLFDENSFDARIGMEIASNETIKQAVMAGLGLSLISAHTVASEVTEQRLAILPVQGLPMQREWLVVRPSPKRLLPAAQTLWGFLTSQGSAFLPTLPELQAHTGRTTRKSGAPRRKASSASRPEND